MNRSLLVVSVLAVALSSLTPSLARAQGAPAVAASPADRAAELKKRGDDAMDSLRYGEALAAYAQAYDLTKDPALLYNQGRALQALGRFPESLAALTRFENQASPELRARVPKLDELIADVRKHVAHLAIRCDVRGARVLVRDRVVGTTPIPAGLDVEAGHANVEVDADGYEPYQRELDLPGGMQTALDVALQVRAQSAVLRVESTAASAVVFIDGRALGNAPIEAVIAPGSHRVAVHRDGYEDTESTIVIAAGEHKDVTLEPQKNAPITTKWWFWTGVGVVVVGGVVTTYALLSEKKAGTGDSFSPSQVAAPIRW